MILISKLTKGSSDHVIIRDFVETNYPGFYVKHPIDKLCYVIGNGFGLVFWPYKEQRQYMIPYLKKLKKFLDANVEKVMVKKLVKFRIKK